MPVDLRKRDENGRPSFPHTSEILREGNSQPISPEKAVREFYSLAANQRMIVRGSAVTLGKVPLENGLIKGFPRRKSLECFLQNPKHRSDLHTIDMTVADEYVDALGEYSPFGTTFNDALAITAKANQPIPISEHSDLIYDDTDIAEIAIGLASEIRKRNASADLLKNARIEVEEIGGGTWYFVGSPRGRGNNKQNMFIQPEWATHCFYLKKVADEVVLEGPDLEEELPRNGVT